MQARSERTRRRLVCAGARMFDQNGYASASLEQIAEAAGMTKGALYFHFASKERLADAVQEHAQAALADFRQRQRAAGVPPVQALIDLSHALAKMLQGDPVVRAGFRIGDECTGRRPGAAGLRQAWTAEVLRLVAGARKAGDLHEHLAADGPETLLCAVVRGLESLSGAAPGPGRLEDRVAALWAFLLPALVPAPHTARYDVRPLSPRPESRPLPPLSPAAAALPRSGGPPAEAAGGS
ncbi:MULTISPECIES: ScbR family autoregulator-binding transcription factor [Streptomyces]|uniref:ScbR family autoregulator-binding transcription factor n=1 Tax=Streptomyces TaxID=1883 RepID=UPI001397EE7D|nr:ScbR family autoregulator-binding transcription factor [Streptomyces sp. 604F]QHV88849.1 TetR/AcrR family transcriptional regulator [Streptomyces sp. 604F]